MTNTEVAWHMQSHLDSLIRYYQTDNYGTFTQERIRNLIKETSDSYRKFLEAQQERNNGLKT